MRETLTNPTTGNTLGTLDFRPIRGNRRGVEVAKIAAGEITRYADGTVSVTLTSRNGRPPLTAADVVTAVIVYGIPLTPRHTAPPALAGRSWDMPGLYGTAGRD